MLGDETVATREQLDVEPAGVGEMVKGDEEVLREAEDEVLLSDEEVLRQAVKLRSEEAGVEGARNTQVLFFSLLAVSFLFYLFRYCSNCSLTFLISHEILFKLI